MKLPFLLIVIFFSQLSYAQPVQKRADTVAYKIIENSLQNIKSYSEGKEIKLGIIAKTIIFFTDLTGIPSESSGNNLGQFSPTYKDYINWNRWYVANKSNIKWDSRSKRIILNKVIVPPI